MPAVQRPDISAAAVLRHLLRPIRNITGRWRAGCLPRWCSTSGLASLVLLTVIPLSTACAADAAADLKAVVLRSYAACDAGIAANDLSKCAAFRAENYKQINVEGQVRTSAQVDGGLSMLTGGRNPVKQVTEVGDIQLLDDTSAIVRIIQTSSKEESGAEIRNKLDAHWETWDTAKRIVERKWHSMGDQRWEKRDGSWRAVELRILSITIEARVLPVSPSSAP